MRKLYFILFILILGSCNGGSEAAYAEITAKEDAINASTEQLKPGEELPEVETDQLLELLENFVNDYPEDEHAPECLDKIHMLFTGRKDYKQASVYAERILKKYPDYVNLAMVLESQAGNYDVFIKPRDTTKVRFYYELLLKEDIPSDKKRDIKDRLEHIDLTIEQYILAQ